MHEHVLLDAGVWYSCRAPGDARFRDEPVMRNNAADVRWHAFSFLDNLRLDDEDVLVNELAALTEAGGSAIVDMTTTGLEGDPLAVRRIAEEVGLWVIVGCGYYVHPSHDPEVCRASVDELVVHLEREVAEGVRGSTVLPGVVGEIGMSAPPAECERRVLKAAARVAHRHGMSLHIHVDNGGFYGPQHVFDCLAEGLPPDRIVCGHMDERMDLEYHEAILGLGANIALDTFGSELYFSGLFHHPSDDQRMFHLAQLVESGHADKVVLGQDVFVKAHLHAYGGNGYDHLIERVEPALRQEYGLSADVLDQLMIHNPRRLLACNPQSSSAVVNGSHARQPRGERNDG
jgi:phosphotriesterase-related protein